MNSTMSVGQARKLVEQLKIEASFCRIKVRPCLFIRSESPPLSHDPQEKAQTRSLHAQVLLICVLKCCVDVRRLVSKVTFHEERPPDKLTEFLTRAVW